MNRREIRTLYGKEIRTQLRERSVVINSILIPVFMYPVMLWVMFSALTFAEGMAEGFTSRVAVVGLPDEHAELVDSLRAEEGVSVGRATAATDVVADRPVADPPPPDSLVTTGEFDAVLAFHAPDPEATGLARNFGATVRYDGAVERSRRARDRVRRVLDRYRSRWLAEEAERLGITEEERRQFAILSLNVAPDREVGSTLLAQLIPLLLIVMVALGCLVPAVDSTAGERERSTWETTLTLGADRSSVILAKYLSVATFGVLAGLLNVLALLVSVGAILEPLLGSTGADFDFSIPLLAVPVLAVGAVGLALFFAAAMMVLASFARSFKEGQAAVVPVYWLVFIPILIGDQPEQHLTPVTAAIPLANVAIMMRDAIQGVFLWPLIGEVILVEAALVAVCLIAATRILRFEDFLLGSHSGSFWRFLKEKVS